MPNPRSGRGFEHLVDMIERMHSVGGARVEFDAHVPGQDTGEMRQIDVAVWVPSNHNDLLIDIECRDHARPLSLPSVEGLITKARDVRANKLIVVSRRGYSMGAKNALANAGATALTLDERGETEWPDWFLPRSFPMVTSGGVLEYFFLSIDQTQAGADAVANFAPLDHSLDTPLLSVADGVLSAIQVVNIWMRAEQGTKAMEQVTDGNLVQGGITFQNEVRLFEGGPLGALGPLRVLGAQFRVRKRVAVETVPFHLYGYLSDTGLLNITFVTDNVEVLGAQRRIALGFVDEPGGDGSRSLKMMLLDAD